MPALDFGKTAERIIMAEGLEFGRAVISENDIGPATSALKAAIVDALDEAAWTAIGIFKRALCGGRRRNRSA